jgi:hypothetical protein
MVMLKTPTDNGWDTATLVDPRRTQEIPKALLADLRDLCRSKKAPRK